MASAILASRNEPYWSENKFYVSEFTPNSTKNPPHFYGRINHIPNPSHCSFNPSIEARNFSVATKRIHDTSSKPQRRHFNGPLPRYVTPLPDRLTERNDSFHREYVIFSLGSYPRREIKELKQRLSFDLERVRGVLKRLETLEVQSRASIHGFQRGEAPESLSLPQPSRLPVNHSAVEILADCQAPNSAGQNLQSSELCARMKSKGKLSGKKRSFPVSSEGGRKLPVTRLDSVFVSMMRRCAQILSKLMKHKFGWVFNTPVDSKGLGLHDYHLIIKHPMDLGTVKLRLDRYEYETPIEFAADVRLTFKNAMIYNPKGEAVHSMAEVLLNNFDDMFRVAYEKYEAEHKKVLAGQKNILAQPEQIVHSRSPQSKPISQMSDMGLSQSTSLHPQQLPTSSNHPHSSGAPVSLVAEKASLVSRKWGKLPKPKAKDPNKRQMTFEEKAKLGIDLQNLPQDKLDHMMHILRRRNSSVSMDGDELELDIETLDNETLWELDRFVGYQKKALRKMKRQGVIGDASPENFKFPGGEFLQNPVLPKDNQDEAGEEEEDVDIGVESPMNNFSPVKIDRDVSGGNSSSSTSSSSDSSSSDSNSSSHRSDSDEGSVQLRFVDQEEAPM